MYSSLSSKSRHTISVLGTNTSLICFSSKLNILSIKSFLSASYLSSFKSAVSKSKLSSCKDSLLKITKFSFLNILHTVSDIKSIIIENGLKKI